MYQARAEIVEILKLVYEIDVTLENGKRLYRILQHPDSSHVKPAHLKETQNV